MQAHVRLQYTYSLSRSFTYLNWINCCGNVGLVRLEKYVEGDNLKRANIFSEKAHVTVLRYGFTATVNAAFAPVTLCCCCSFAVLMCGGDFVGGDLED